MAKSRETLWYERTNTPADAVLKAATDLYRDGRSFESIIKWAAAAHGLKLAINEDGRGDLMIHVEAELEAH